MVSTYITEFVSKKIHLFFGSQTRDLSVDSLFVTHCPLVRFRCVGLYHTGAKKGI